MGHTPGPWEIQQSPDCWKYLQVISPSYRQECDAEHVVCELRRWRRPDPAQDARLIASAPELLAALKAIKHDLLALDSGDVGNGVDGWRHMDATFVDQLISGSFRVAQDAINKAEGRAE